MSNWKNVLIPLRTTIREALKILDQSSLQVALVVDATGRLRGTVTDGDVRRGILRNINFDDPVTSIMFSDFTWASINASRESILATMREKQLAQIPILDSEGRVVDLKTLRGMITQPTRSNWVLLMAGGLGTRLRPLTEDCPKPLLHVGGRPVLETIITGFKEYGFRKFFLSVNYKAEMIEKHFGDGSRLDVDISYLRETERLGTAGCLSLFPQRPTESLFVMNGDLLTRINFEQMLQFHESAQAIATMGIREYTLEVPYGIVEVDNGRILALREKPVQKFLVNAGVYALRPEILDMVRPGEYLDMPELFDRAIASGRETAAFPIHEYWLDIGRRGDYDRANNEYDQYFPCTMSGCEEDERS